MLGLEGSPGPGRHPAQVKADDRLPVERGLNGFLIPRREAAGRWPVRLQLNAGHRANGGALLQKVPLTHFCDYIKVIGDKVYILDKDRLGQFYVYRIEER